MSERKRKLEVYEAQPSNGVASAVPSFGNGTVNLYTGRPYSQRYYDILSKRKGESRALASPCFSPLSPSRAHACMRPVTRGLLAVSLLRASQLDKITAWSSQPSCATQGCRCGRRGRTSWP